jgi:short-subunit dehydrogenase
MKIAIITGASSGLGSEFVRQISRKEKLGEIWVIARRKGRLTALQKESQTHLRIITGDLTKPETLREIEAMLWKEKPESMRQGMERSVPGGISKEAMWMA